MKEAENHEQCDGSRQHFLAEGKQRQRQAHVRRIGKHQRGQKGVWVVAEQARDDPGDQP